MASTQKWSYRAGRKGCNRVRAYERPSGLYVEHYESDPETGERRRVRVALGHSDRERAKKEADQLAGMLAVQEPTSRPTTLRELFESYGVYRTPQVGESQREHHRRCVEMFCRFFGARREAASLDRRAWDAFAQTRRSGLIDARGCGVPEKERRPVSARTVKRDLQALRAALTWAVGADLLEHDPTAGYPFPRVPTPERPRVSSERYEAMRAVAACLDWRFGLALVLAFETGHRIGAIRHLRWTDVDLAERTVRWRSATDKMRSEHVTPLTGGAVTALRAAQQHAPSIGEAWVLPSPRDASRPCSRERLRHWWVRAEKLAKLPHMRRLGWHGLRRTFADELRDAPNVDLARLGGWASTRTLEEVYQGSSLETLRRAQAKRRSG